jgi:regulator of sigma E protease
MTTVLAFIVALALLIAVHEYGHYRMAVACGVKVLRFSIGFGPVLLRWKPRRSPTEFVLCAFPLGGYVRMLDEREAPVASHEQHMAFNRRPLGARAAIVSAGPLANLLLAVMLYALVNWIGTREAAPVLASPVPESIAARAGLQGGERVARASLGADEPIDIASFEGLRWILLRAALHGDSLELEVSGPQDRSSRQVRLDFSGLEAREADARLMRQIGLTAPYTRPELGDIMPGGAAQRAGLQSGDGVLAVNGRPVVDGTQLRELIRTYGRQGEMVPQRWLIQRQGSNLELAVAPDLVDEGEQRVGRIGAYVGAPVDTVLVRYGPLDGVTLAWNKMLDVSVLSLSMMGRMLVGQASLSNLSGPLTIADYAGRSARVGLVPYLVFLALISVSLGVLNLLPLPMLDGGHLMYYLWEAMTGRPVTDLWLDRLQRGGAVFLMFVMSVAVFNDVVRLFGG